MVIVCLDGTLIIVNKKNFYNMWKVFLLMFVVVAIISYFWVRGIDYMKENHPDYKGEDFLNWSDEDTDWLN
jgi:purine-cytosine permease-like protein